MKRFAKGAPAFYVRTENGVLKIEPVKVVAYDDTSCVVTSNTNQGVYLTDRHNIQEESPVIKSK